MNAGASFPRPRRVPLLLQSEAAECGLACIAMIATSFGHEVDLNEIRHRFHVSQKGTTLRDLATVAEALGLSARALRIEPQAMSQVQCPAILHMDMSHFVVLKGMRGAEILIHDPALGVRRLSPAQIDRHFTGIVLELEPDQLFARKTARSKLSLKALAGRIPLPRGILGKGLILSALVQLLVLASPLYIQIVIDRGLTQGDSSALMALAIGFALIALLRGAVAWVRGRTLLALGGLFDVQLMRNIVRRMLRLPNSWFEARHVAAVLSRISSTQPIRDLVSEGLIAAVVDGIMAVLVMTIAVLFSPGLALVVIAGFAVNALVKWWQVRRSIEREFESVEALSKAQQEFMETVRGIATVKLFGKESDRERRWIDRHVDSVNARYAVAIVKTRADVARDFVQAIVMALVIYIGVAEAIAGLTSLGVVMAFLAYQQMFADSSAKLLDFAGRYGLLRVHLQRLADVIESEPEVHHWTASSDGGRQLVGGVSARDLGFRYGDLESPIFTSISFSVEAGEFVAITGPSGGGKTTLMKLLVGLLEPTSGEIRYDDVPIARLGMKIVRDSIGVVMQDDLLLSGSIAQNITFFDADPDPAWMRECARMAAIHDEIAAWPMGYNTLVGDMGTVFSGGQRQRVLLARALYRRPRILFVDEGTSSLDIAKEREVNRNIQSLDLTRIVIAHRPETIEAADRILELRDQCLHDL